MVKAIERLMCVRGARVADAAADRYASETVLSLISYTTTS